MIDLTKYQVQAVELSRINFADKVFQFRVSITEKDVKALAILIKDKGQEVPVIIWQRSNGELVLICGYRRYTAVKLNGQNTINGIIIPEAELPYKEAIALSISENVDRENYADNDYIGIVALLSKQGMSYSEIAESIHKSHSTVVDYMLISKLSVEIQDAIKAGKVSSKVVLKLVRTGSKARGGQKDRSAADQGDSSPDASNHINAENTAKLVEILKSPDCKALIKNLLADFTGGDAAKAKTDGFSLAKSGKGLDAQCYFEDENISEADFLKAARAVYRQWQEKKSQPDPKAIKAAEAERTANEAKAAKLEAEIKSREVAAKIMEEDGNDSSAIRQVIEKKKAEMKDIKAKLKAAGKTKPVSSLARVEETTEANPKAAPSFTEVSNVMPAQPATKPLADKPASSLSVEQKVDLTNFERNEKKLIQDIEADKVPANVLPVLKNQHEQMKISCEQGLNASGISEADAFVLKRKIELVREVIAAINKKLGGQ